MECIDCVSDLDKLDAGIHLQLENVNEEVGKLTIEARQMSDVYFLKAIQYGKVFLESEYDFDILYDKGFRMCAIESFEDELNGSVTFQSSDLHNIVYNAIMDITDGDFNKPDFINFLKEQDG
jgi:hypothetical protein